MTAYGMTGDLGTAEEITQEAFTVAYGRRGRVSRTDGPEAWLRTVVVNLARRRFRRMPIAAGDGSLLPTGTTTYVSTDQGRTFTRTGEELFGRVTWSRAGYLRSNVDEFALSSDGLRWREFAVRQAWNLLAPPCLLFGERTVGWL